MRIHRAVVRPEPRVFPRSLVPLLGVAALAGIVLRAILYGSAAGTLDSDDGAVGLMARHAAHGDIPLIFWGQNYGGTQEVLLTAPLFLIFGTNGWALRAVPFILVAVTAVLVWRIGLRTSSPVSAAAAAAVFWVAPAYFIYKTSHQHGFYASGLFWSAVVLLLVLRLAERESRRELVLLGLVLGLAWWETPQIVTVAVPALAWLAWYRPAVIRNAWLLVPAALLGMAPWLAWNAGHHWSSVTNPPGNGEPLTVASYLDHVRAYVSSLTPMNLDLRTPFTSSWLLGKLPAEAIYAVLLMAFAVLGWRRRRRPVSLLVAVMVGYPLMYAISPAAWNAAEPRYALLSLPALALLLAYPLRTLSVAWVGVGVATVLSALAVTRMDGATQAIPGAAYARHFAPLISELNRRHVDRVYADYWIAYRLTFETGEHVIAAHTNLNQLEVRGGRVIAPSPGWSRNWSYNHAVNESRHAAVVFARSDRAEHHARHLLMSHRYTRDVLSSFVIYIPPRHI